MPGLGFSSKHNAGGEIWSVTGSKGIKVIPNKHSVVISVCAGKGVTSGSDFAFHS